MRAAISVEYLTGRAEATCVGNPKIPEFPAHPARLFATLVSNFYAGLEGEYPLGRDALKVLAELPVEGIYAAKGRRLETVTAFYPTHGKNPWLSSLRDIAQDCSAARSIYLTGTLLEGPEQEVQYHYNIPDEKWDLYGQVLQRLVQATSYLGTSDSQVKAQILTNPVALKVPNIVPSSAKDAERMRVSYDGFLEELERTFEINTRRYQQSGSLDSYSVSKLPHYHYQGFVRKDERPYYHEGRWKLIGLCRVSPKLHPNQTMPLAKAVRDTILRAVEHDLGRNIPSVISGHSPEGTQLQGDHMALLPLQECLGVSSSGLVSGLILAFPRDSEYILLATQALELVRRVRIPNGTTVEVELLKKRVVSKTLQYRTWTGPSRFWMSTYPVAIPKKIPGKCLGQKVARMLVQEGWPIPETVEVYPHTITSGTLHPKNAPKYKDYIHRHVRVAFPVRVKGPTAIGPGRYCGPGLLIPIRDWRES
jgi:CRISPR-associated protein Csb2